MVKGKSQGKKGKGKGAGPLAIEDGEVEEKVKSNSGRSSFPKPREPEIRQLWSGMMLRLHSRRLTLLKG